ncbi:class I adenylate-forming enzyme family protein [Cohnella suwonensis]|uniref:Class I adenylate-forming enzyme family protein n=1 Tax=Cohnella suwonensis TaxID=696072 RepID=A0ABW0LTF9_9BACL
MKGGALVGLFEQTARPDRGFRYGEAEFISYADLFAEAGKLSAALGRLGQRPRFIAAIWMEPSPECYMAFMAIVLANGIPVPLHGNSSAEQVADVLGKLEAEVLLTSSARLDEVLRSEGIAREAGQGTIIVDGITGEAGEGMEASIRPGFRRRERVYTPPEETAVVFMSSGSTGKPKGILLSESNLLSNMASIQASLRLTDEDTVLITKSFGYSSTVTGEWLLALHAGMQIALAPGLLHPLQLVLEIKRSRPTFLCTVPAVLLPLAKSGKWDEQDLQSLTKLIVVGAAMPPETLLQLQMRLPKVEIMPCYGLTEASPRVTCLPAGQLASKSASAGLAIPGVTIAVYREGMPAAPGEEGEIVVNGPNVMLGYYDDERRTANVLTSGGLRTMDRGYMDGDGFLFLTGRTDNAFNVAGHLFHPEMLEKALLSHPAVRESAVTGMPDEISGYRPIAFVIPDQHPVEDERNMVAQLHAYCLNRFTAAGRPKEIIIVRELPRTQSGKPDRTAIQLMAKERNDDLRNGSIAAGTDGY